MVRRLVEKHQVGLGEQQPGEQQPILLAAGKLGHFLLERSFGEAKPFEHSLDAIVEVVSVMMLKLVLNVLEAMLQAIALRLRRFGADCMGDFLGVPARSAILASAAAASSHTVRPGSNSGCCSR